MATDDSSSAEKDTYLYLYTRPTHSRSEVKQYQTAPLISLSLKSTVPPDDIPQYSFLGCEIHPQDEEGEHVWDEDPILLNTNAPWSAFLCGSQGSGKSHTMSCMLEDCIYPTARIGRLPEPLAGIVFHYHSQAVGGICEAAHLASLDGLKVTVLVSRSNFQTLSSRYNAELSTTKNLEIYPLVFQPSHLNIERIQKMMAFTDKEGSVPLYMEVLMRILRDMAMTDAPFSYRVFRNLVAMESLNPGQKSMMDLRFNLLESFLDMTAINTKKNKKCVAQARDIFTAAPGTLTIVDLSDPFLDPSTVCVLFEMCLGIFEQNRPSSGFVVGLDEAHKYMNKSTASGMFTDHLLTTVREQRHNAARVIIATQEPTISPKLLDLCSMTYVHRFTSPEWLLILKAHLAAASSIAMSSERDTSQMFEQIVGLSAGECLLFAPSAMISRGGRQTLGSKYILFKTRQRLSMDGGASMLAVGSRRQSSSLAVLHR